MADSNRDSNHEVRVKEGDPSITANTSDTDSEEVFELDSSDDDNDSVSCVPASFDSEASASSASASQRSLIDRLRSPTPSDLCRKRSIANNNAQASVRKRLKKPKKNSDSTSVTPSQRVEEFNNQKLIISAGKLFCLACREELSLKKSVIKNHIVSTKHTIGKKKINSKEKREKDIAESVKKYEFEHPSGETLPTSVRVYRVKVCTTFLRAGVPINRIDKFRDILEENGLHLAGRKPMSDLIPFILSEEVQRLKSEIKDKPISVIFDGTCRLGEALVITVRYVSDAFTIERLIKLQILTKSLAGEEIAREVLSVLSIEYGISSYDLVGTMRDRASSNNVAIQIMKILYPNMLDIGLLLS